MSFLNLWALWIAAAAVPALLILYFLKLRRREETVPSTLLWKRAVQDLQVNAPFQRLRKNLLLLLQLLILAAAIIALARPIVASSAVQESRIVILIDRSASMNTREGDRTRLDLAKEQAARRARTFNQTGSRWFSFTGAKAATQVMVIAFAQRAAVVSPFTTNMGEVVELIRGIQPTDAPTDIGEAFQLAEAYMSPAMLTDQMANTPISAEEPARVILYTDGKLPSDQSLALKSGNVEWVRIGEAADNVGITNLRAQRNYEDPDQVAALLQVRNFGPEPVETDVSIYLDGVLADVKPVSLAAAPPPDAPAGATQPSGSSVAALTFDLTLTHAARLEARLSRSDPLTTDNSAFAIIPPPRRLRVLVVTGGNDFIDSALRGLPLQDFIFVTPQQYEADPASFESDTRSRFDVVIFDKFAPEHPPQGNYIYFGASPRIPEIEAQGETSNVALIWWNETHPVLRHVPLDFVAIGRALKLRFPKEAITLIDGPEGPLMSLYSKDGRTYLVAGFVVENRAWWSRPAFPVFVYNAVRFLGGISGEGDEQDVRPGDTVRLVLPGGAGEAKVSGPEGIRATVKPDSSGSAYFAGTQRVGVYTADPAPEGRGQFAVNLVDDWESDIAPPKELKIGSVPVAEGKSIRAATPEVWRWFVGAALAVALIEWYIYNRRVMI